jgi:hypothetical protein
VGETFYRRMWFLAMLYNVAGGILIFIFVAPVLGSASISQPVPEPPLYYQAWVAMFATIGIGYWFVYRNLYQNRDIVIMGIIGKLAFATLCLFNTFTYPGRIPLIFTLAALGDLTFAFFFWRFLSFQQQAKTQMAAGEAAHGGDTRSRR